MKKILLATTLLVGTAGFAAAEVATTGTARMGIVNDGTDTEFSSRVRIIFTGSGETDGGLSFGASVRADQSGQGNTANGDSTVFISGAFGKLTFGDVSGAADALVGQVSGVGFTGLGDRNEIGFVGTLKTAAYFEYSAGSLTLGVGVGQTDGDEINLGAKYSVDAFSVAIGYEDDGAETQVSLSGSTTISGATLKARYSDNDAASDGAYAVSLDYGISGATVTTFYSSDFTSRTSFGLGASYDLGGGATVAAGYTTLDGGEDTYEAGVKFAF